MSAIEIISTLYDLRKFVKESGLFFHNYSDNIIFLNILGFIFIENSKGGFYIKHERAMLVADYVIYNNAHGMFEVYRDGKLAGSLSK